VTGENYLMRSLMLCFPERIINPRMITWFWNEREKSSDTEVWLKIFRKENTLKTRFRWDDNIKMGLRYFTCDVIYDSL
jgi:hypothetical protein